MGLGGRLSPLAKQTWVVSSVLIMTTEQGMIIGHASTLVKALTDPSSSIVADMPTITWIVSSLGSFLFLGLILFSLVMDSWGRRTSYIVAILPAMLGWVTMYFANGVTALVAARMLGGLTGGGIIVLGSVIVGEFTTPKYRGMFLTLKTAGIAFGCTISHILGNFFNWRTVGLFALGLNVIAVGIAFTWPETPAWLASIKQFERCEESFLWLRGSDENEKRELDKLFKAQKGVMIRKTGVAKSTVKFLRKFLRKDFIKPGFNIFVASILLEACGKHYFASYASIIIGEMIGSDYDHFYFTLSLDIIITGSIVASSILTKYVKLRTLLFATGIVGLFVLTLDVIYLYLTSVGLVPNYPWISIGLLVLFFISVNLGCTPITYTWMGELFPLQHKSTGCFVCGCFLNVIAVVFMKITPYLISDIKVYGMFGVFGIILAISLFVNVKMTGPRTVLRISWD